MIQANSFRTQSLSEALEDIELEMKEDVYNTFFEAVKADNDVIVKKMLDENKVNCVWRINTAFIWACEKGCINAAAVLLADKRVNPLGAHTSPQEALLKAVQNGFANVVQLLLKDERVDPTVKGNFYEITPSGRIGAAHDFVAYAPLRAAVINKYLDVVYELCQRPGLFEFLKNDNYRFLNGDPRNIYHKFVLDEFIVFVRKCLHLFEILGIPEFANYTSHLILLVHSHINEPIRLAIERTCNKILAQRNKIKENKQEETHEMIIELKKQEDPLVMIVEHVSPVTWSAKMNTTKKTISKKCNNLCESFNNSFRRK